MGDREDGESYGFAPRGQQARRDAGKTSRPLPNRQRPEQHPALAPMAPAYSHERTEKSIWLWLGIGILLGIGATLLTSSFWLPQSNDINLVDLEENEPTAPGVASANEAMRTTPSAVEESGPEAPTVGGVSINGVAPPERSNGDTEPPAIAEVAEQTGSEARLASLDPALTSTEGSGRRETAGQDLKPAVEEVDQAEGADLDGPVSPEQTTSERLLPADDAQTQQDVDAKPGGIDSDGIDLETGDASEASALDRPAVEQTKVDQGDGNVAPQEILADLVATAEENRAKPLPPAADIEPDDGSNGVDIAALAPVATSSPPPPSRTSTGSAEDRGRLYRVQLAAVANEAAAQVYWREVNERLPGVFSDIKPVFNERIVDQRLYLRIWVGSFGRRSEADTYCGWLKEQGQDCFVTRVDNL